MWPAIGGISAAVIGAVVTLVGNRERSARPLRRIAALVDLLLRLPEKSKLRATVAQTVERQLRQLHAREIARLERKLNVPHLALAIILSVVLLAAGFGFWLWVSAAAGGPWAWVSIVVMVIVGATVVIFVVFGWAQIFDPDEKTRAANEAAAERADVVEDISSASL